MKKVKWILLFLTILASSQGCAQNTSDKAINKQSLLDREKAIAIAEEYLFRTYGEVKSEKDFKYLSYDEVGAWERYDKFGTREVKNKILQFHREKKLFWLIWFCPSSEFEGLGVGTFVFVDRTTGQVLYEIAPG